MNTVKNILIADDSEMNRQILADILGGEYKYLYAADGQEAIEMLARGTDVDLMLLDINMPNMNGFKVLDIMERRCWLDEIPVIVGERCFIRSACIQSRRYGLYSKTFRCSYRAAQGGEYPQTVYASEGPCSDG